MTATSRLPSNSCTGRDRRRTDRRQIAQAVRNVREVRRLARYSLRHIGTSVPGLLRWSAGGVERYGSVGMWMLAEVVSGPEHRSPGCLEWLDWGIATCRGGGHAVEMLPEGAR